MSTPLVVLTCPLPQPAPEILATAAHVQVLADGLTTAGTGVAGADVVCAQLTDRIDTAVLDAAGPRLRAVCNYAVGFDNIDVAAATARGVYVTNTPDVLTAATADCAMGLILMAARRLREGDSVLRSGGYRGWSPEFMLGMHLEGATLALIGFGRIGRAVAARADAFGMHVVYVDDSVTPHDGLPGNARPVTFAEALAEADVISLHAPLRDSTHHLIDETALHAMKPTAVLVNTARGPIVDERALVRALNEGWIAAAGLDVYENEPDTAPGLTACPNAVLAPHLGSATVTTRAAMAEICARNAVAALGGTAPPDAVNAVAVQAARRAR